MVPRNFVLFNPGPVNLDSRIKDHLFDAEFCHRQPEFLDLYERTRSGLHTLLGFAHDEYALGLLHGSGTLAVDAALATFVRGRVVVVDNGLYCQRIIRTLGSLGVEDVTEVTCGIGGVIDTDEVREVVNRVRPDWICCVHHETTTGILNPLDDLHDVASEFEARLFVDAVSSVGAHDVAGRGDVLCFNSSKCLEALPGIAGVFWRSDLVGHPTLSTLDVLAYSAGMASTPNVQAFISLDIALELYAAEDRFDRYRRLARHVCDRGSRDFELFIAEQHRSNVLTSFRLGGRTIEDLERRAAQHRFVIYPGQAALRDEVFRVANMGAAINERTIDALFDALA